MDLGSWIPSPIEISIGLIGFNLHTDHKHVHILLNNAEKSTMRKLLKPWYSRRKQGVGGSGGGGVTIYANAPPLDPPWAGPHMWPVNEVSQITTHCASHNTFLILFYTNPLISKNLMQIGQTLRNQRDPKFYILFLILLYIIPLCKT